MIQWLRNTEGKMFEEEIIGQNDGLDEDFDQNAELAEYEEISNSNEAKAFAAKFKELFNKDEIKLNSLPTSAWGKNKKKTTVVTPREFYSRLGTAPVVYSRLESGLRNNLMCALLCLKENVYVYNHLPKQLQTEPRVLKLAESKIDKHMGYMPSKDFGKFEPDLICLKLRLRFYSEKSPDIINELAEMLEHSRKVTMLDVVRELVTVNPYIYKYIYDARYDGEIPKTTAKVKHKINVTEKVREDLYEIIDDPAILNFLNRLPLNGGGNPLNGINPYKMYDKKDHNPRLNVLRFRYEQNECVGTQMLNMSDEEYAEFESYADKYCNRYYANNSFEK